MNERWGAAAKRILEANATVDWRRAALADPRFLEALDFCDADRCAVLPLLQAYQRILHILPPGEESRAIPLLQIGLHSAVQIAGLPRDEFLSQFCAVFSEEAAALGLQIYGAAQGRRSELLLYYINRLQNNEPHYRAARFK